MKTAIQFIAAFLLVSFIFPAKAAAAKINLKKYYCIQARISKMNLSNSNSTANNKLLVQRTGNTPDNHWMLIPAGDGYYYIKSKNSALFLSASIGGYVPKPDIKQKQFNGTDTQKWKLKKPFSGEYYFIKNKATGLYLDVKGGSKKNNNPVIQYKFNLSPAQQWRFLAIGGNVPKMSRIVNAALFGPKANGVKIFNHTFNFRPSTRVHIDPQTGIKTVSGSFSHHLTARPDDQYFFRASFSRMGNLLTYNHSISRGGFKKLVSGSSKLGGNRKNRFPSNVKGLNLTDKNIKTLRAKAVLRLDGRGNWKNTAKELALIIACAANGN